MVIRARRLPAAAAAVVATLAAFGLGGAQAAPPAATAAVASGGAAHGIRPPHGGTDAAVLVDGETTVRKARTTVRLPRVVLRTYANETSVIKNDILSSSSPAWVVTHPGRHPGFGVFPDTRTTVLGFGAIPIVATLHLRQLVRHGRITPLTIRTKTQTVAPFATQPTHVSGLVQVRISNVLVDQVPLRVGSHCRTATPMHLHLVGISPQYNLFTGGPLDGKVTIPPFTGCGIGRDDLDPLLTGTISGPDNPLHMIQGILGTWDPKRPHDCNGCKPPVHHR
ncbi:MAG TPA: hypothetical protein VFH38_09015 [Jatrophihabitans sp.]|nr:hypothetical protein [Jatrophihabitans sp.]